MAEWHITPEHILENWTDEGLDLWFNKRNERIVQANAMMEREFGRERNQFGGMPSHVPQQISDLELFRHIGVGRSSDKRNVN